MKVLTFDFANAKRKNPSRLKRKSEEVADLTARRENKTQEELQFAAMDRSLNGFDAYKRVIKAIRLKWFSQAQAEGLVAFLKDFFAITEEDLEADLRFRKALLENAARQAGEKNDSDENRGEGALAIQALREMSKADLFPRNDALAVVQWAKFFYL